jgi:hypothetical protein
MAALPPALAQGKRGFTPPDPVTFGVRIESGDLAQAREWLDAGLDPDYVADRIGTGLMIASWYGNLPMMRLFLERGADVNRSNLFDEQAIMHAAWRGQIAAIELLLAHGARINNPGLRWSALHYAAFAGQREAAALLLARGADLNARSTNGSSPLMMAIYEGKDDMARDLLARGADTSIRNDRGDGALEWAFKFQRLAIARLVADRAQFAAAANRPKESWGAPVRSVASPAAPPAEATRDESAARVAELERVRAILAERGMKDAVAKMDRRIALLKEAALPVPGAAGASAASRGGTQLSEVEDLLQVRRLLAERGLTASVKSVDRRIAALRARRARPDLATPVIAGASGAATLEITARRAAPEAQRTRLVIDANAPLP